MNSPRQPGEFPRTSPEAASEQLVQLQEVIVRKITGSGAYYTPERGGFGCWTMPGKPGESYGLIYRPAQGSGPYIQDNLTKKDVPDAIAYYHHSIDDFGATTELTRLAVVEEVWLRVREGSLQARRRFYSVEHPDYDALGTLAEPDRYQALDQLASRRLAQRQRQPDIDAQEEVLGLNRLSSREVEELTRLIQQPSAVVSLYDAS